MAPEEGSAAASLTRPSTLSPMAWLKWLYDWVLHWAQTPYGMPALAILAFAESSFFPVPPDVLLIALCLGVPSRSFYFAAVAAIASVAGGVGGYMIGWLLWEQVQDVFFTYVFSRHVFDQVAGLYQENAFWAVFTGGHCRGRLSDRLP
jgi:membrane protein YqaA with SNARE-associated domain